MFVAALILTFALLPGTDAIAAESSIRGTVRDESGAVLPGAHVVARNASSNLSRTAVTDGAGRYELVVEPGDYEISADLLGFRADVAIVSVRAAETRTVDITLEIAPLAVTETVSVTRREQSRLNVPNAVSVVEEGQIQRDQRRVSPSESLGGLPGLFAENRRNYSMSGGVRLAIRAPMSALGMRGLHVIQDGIPLTMADGTTQPGSIELGSAGRMEVLRGPSSVLYGNSAGGVVQIRTAYPEARRLAIEPDVQVGSYGYQRLQFKAEGTSGRMGYVFNASRVETDGYRQHSHADVRQANVMLRAALEPNTEVRGVFNLFDLPFGESSSTLTLADAQTRPRTVRQLAIDQGWGESATQGQGGVTLEHQFGSHMVRATAWAVWRNAWNPIPSRVIDLGRAAAGFRSEYQGDGRLGRIPIEWTVGFDVSDQRDDRTEYQNLGIASAGARTRQGTLLVDQLERVRSLAPFAQASIEIAPRWRLTAGARYDHYNFSASDDLLNDGDQSGTRTMDAASPMIGITHTASDWLSVYANVATAYQTPTAAELSNRPTGEGGFNEDLEPEDLRSIEFGARGSVERWRLVYEVAAYRSSLTNALVSFQRADEQTYFRNAGESRRTGAELLVGWSPLERVSTRFAYTHQNFTFKQFVTSQADFSGKREPGAPPNQMFVAGTYESPFGLRSTAQFRWIDAYPVNNANTFSNWSYRVVDLRFGFERRLKSVAVRPFFGIDNVFDERYNASTSPNAVANRFYEPAPGREIFVGLTIGAGLF